MEQNAYRDGSDTGQPDANQPDAYHSDACWRCRVSTLCAGPCPAGLLAWAFSGGGGQARRHEEGRPDVRRPATAAYSGTPASPSSGAGASASAGSSASPVRTFKLAR